MVTPETITESSYKSGKGSRPVVLVHGIFDTASIFSLLADRLKARGFHPLAVDLRPSDGSLGLDELAAQLAACVDSRVGRAEQVDLIGFSMGGIVSRYYVQRLGGMARVRRLITISAPHRGTYTAFAMSNLGAKQMRPGSKFLEDLNRDTIMLERVRFASIWTPFDLMIFPAASSRLGVGQEFQIPVALHPWMLRSSRIVEIVVKLLNQDAENTAIQTPKQTRI